MSTSVLAPEPSATRLHRSGRGAPIPLISLLLLLLTGSVLVAIGAGTASVPPADTARYLFASVTGGTIPAEEATRYQIIWQIRTPRVLLAATVGAGLSAVGVATQALVRNALADPYILGIASGGAVGAVGVTLLGALAIFGIYAVSVGAFAGALLATVLVNLMARSAGAMSPLRLVLTGVALSFGFQAVMSVLIYLVPTGESTSTVLFWTMGSFGAATWGELPVVAVLVLAGVMALLRLARPLDVMTLGDETAVSMGINLGRSRQLLFLITAVMTGAMVAVSGAIGFVGLVVPHIVRMLVGAPHLRVLLIAPLLGANLMVWVDLLARTLVAPRELPLGVLTALIGVPIFLLLLRRRQYVFGGTR